MMQSVVLTALQQHAIVPFYSRSLVPVQRTQADEEIVKFAYCMAIGEQRYFDLMESLEQRLHELLMEDEFAAQDAQSRGAITAELEALEDHFSNAMSLLDLNGRQKDSVPFSEKIMLSSDTPAALVDREGRVVLANEPARIAFGFAVGSFVSADLFEAGQHSNFLSNLARINDFAENKVISMFGMQAPDMADPLHIAMMRIDRLGGDALSYLEVARVNWLPEKAAHFQSLFGLTPSEMDITKGLVRGDTLADIAGKRGRSVGTVRQQMKQLLSKLELRSQTELVCLYSGVVKYDGYVAKDTASTATDNTFETNRLSSFTLSDGRRLEYELAGYPGDQPVLYLPALLGGSVITEEMTAALAQNGLRLIIPWRGPLGRCDGQGPPELQRLEDYASDIASFLDHLGIERIAVMGHITSAMYAYALGRFLPDRISHVINVNGIVPVNSGSHVKMLNRTERLRFHIYRHLPKVTGMVMHSMLKVVDSGQDLEFMRVFLKQNPEDLATIDREDIQRTFRAAHDYITINGFGSFIHELTIASLDWQSVIDELPCPLLNMVGEKNLSFTPELARTFEAEKGLNLNLEVIERAGHLALYQRPNLIIRKLAEFVRSA